MRAAIHFLSCAGLLVTLTLGLSGSAVALEPTSTDALARFRLKAARTEPALQQTGRYTLRGRFAPEVSTGELREGGDFVLIGRFAKAGVGCDANTVFSNGFEN